METFQWHLMGEARGIPGAAALTPLRVEAALLQRSVNYWTQTKLDFVFGRRRRDLTN